MTLVLTLLLLSYGLSGAEPNILKVSVHTESFDDNETWVGVFEEGVTLSSDSISWSRESTPEFFVTVSSERDISLVFLKKNCVPIVQSLTPELLEAGLNLKFSRGVSIFGVVTMVSGESLPEGRVSIDRLHDVEFNTPYPELLSWEIEEDGTFEIHGLRPNFEYLVTADAPGFMPAIAETTLSTDETRREVNFQLAKATFITGHIVDRFGTKIRVELDAVVSPLESQTTDVHTEFDDDDDFRIGPFAEGAAIALTAHDDLDRRSKVVEVQTPTDNVKLLVLRWIPFSGTVQNEETGEAVEEFQIIRPDIEGGSGINISDPNGHFEIEIDELAPAVSIIATGFLYWESSRYMQLKERDSYDLGIVELKPAHTIRGRVLDSTSRLPIEDAVLRRIQRQGINFSIWIFNNVITTTDSDGEFELSGFSSDGDELRVGADGYQIAFVPLDDVESYLEIELEPSNGSISGRVVSGDGTPIHPAWVSIGRQGYHRNEEDGTFSFIWLKGTYQVSASATIGESDVLEVIVENEQHISDIELVIHEKGRVHGTVTGLLDGESASVGVAGRWGGVQSDGTYEVGGVPIGEHVITCVTTKGRKTSAPIEMNETMEAQIDFVFEGTSSISGRVTLAGQPATELEVRATPIDENHSGGQAETVGDGTYLIEGLVEGDYMIHVISRGISQQAFVSGETQVDIDLGSTELSGRIQSSESVLGVHVYLTGSGEEGRFQMHTTVDEKGFYRFLGIASGSYEIIVYHENFKTVTRTVEVEASVQDVDFQLQSKDQKDKEVLTKFEQNGL
ncbi:MAG: carboxypeptidase-like regulatory domain-containing protein [Gammaproteobacteria bacterium]|nr:carboxypeptidase-like regulatory domain-containing protein [Gammaproteobacteria bacterium]